MCGFISGYMWLLWWGEGMRVYKVGVVACCGLWLMLLAYGLRLLAYGVTLVD